MGKNRQVFPSKHKFKEMNRKRKREKLSNMYSIIKNSISVKDVENMIQNISQRDIYKIERRTVHQAKESDWIYYRRGVVTSTITKRIDTFFRTAHPLVDSINESISKRYNSNLNYPAIVYGRESEPFAIADFFSDFKKKHSRAKLIKVGLKLDKSLKFFGGSADALVSYAHQNTRKNFVVEIKAPYRLKDKSVLKEWRILEYLSKDQTLKKNHSHYFQLQCYLGLFGISTGLFVVWSKIDFLVIPVEFDQEFFEKIRRNVKNYYFKHYIPHVLNTL